MVDVEADAAVPVDPDDDDVDDVIDGGTEPATVVLPVLDAVLPDAVEVEDVTPPVDRSCPRIARRDCSSASSADELLLEAPDPVVDEDVEDPVGLAVAMWVKPSEAPPVEEVEDPGVGAGGEAATGSVVAMWVKLSEAPPADDPEGGAGGDAATGGGIAMWVKLSVAPPADEPEGGAGGVPLMGGVEEEEPVDPLVPVLVATTPGAPFIWSCDSTARKPDEAALAAGSTGVASDCVSVWSDRSGMDGVEPFVEAVLLDWA